MTTPFSYKGLEIGLDYPNPLRLGFNPTSYFENRTMRISIKNVSSDEHVLNYSLPQQSIIGPQGFILYTAPVGDIIRRHNICFHCYADDV